MFTQCPACETIFKISAEVLRVAAGEARCGRCGEVFNALRSLAEEPRAFATGETAQEQEVRADRILRTVAPPTIAPTAEEEEFEADGMPGTQIVQLEIQGADEFIDLVEEETPAPTPVPASAPAPAKSIADDPSMEFTLPPGELDRIFVEARPHHFVRGRHNLLRNADIDEIEPVSPERLSTNDPTEDGPRAVAPGAVAPNAAEPRAAAPAGGEELAVSTPALQNTALSKDPPLGEKSQLAARAEIMPPPRPSAPELTTEEIASAPRIPRQIPEYLRAAQPDDNVAAPAPAAAPAASSTAADRNDWIEQIIPTSEIEDFEPRGEPHRGAWTAAAALFAMLLAMQIVHHNRAALAQSPAIGGALRSLYKITGHPLPLVVNLSAFEVRQWGVTGDASASGTLRVRASLINTSATAQPYPLMRLALADRFGTRVGVRDFKPHEYLRRTPARPLDPGERADTLVEIIDPGKTAEGFEIDVCEQQLDAGVICANDSATPAK